MSTLSCAGKYLGAQPESSQNTLPLCSATAVISSTQGQPGMRRDDREVREVGGELVDRRRMRVAQLRAHAAGHSGAHPGRADVDHHRHLERVDRLEQRVERAVVDREMAHDRVEVEAQHAEISDRVLGFANCIVALERIDRTPRPG